MIKVGVSGCDTLRAHELVRVLVNHPDVELRWVSDHGHAGTRLDQVVPGLVGESDLTVVASGSPDEVDLVFLCGNPTPFYGIIRTFKGRGGFLPLTMEETWVDFAE